MKECDICGDIGKIHLPVRRKYSFSFNEENNLQPQPSKIREYPCPECSEKIPFENLQIVQMEQEIYRGFISQEDMNTTNRIRYEEEMFEALKEKIAYFIAKFLYEENMITFQIDEKHSYDIGKTPFSKRIIGKLGVLSPKQVSKFEDRLQENSINVVKEIIQRIQNHCYRPDIEMIGKSLVFKICYEILEKLKKK